MKVLVGAFNQEKALVGAFSVIVKTDRSFTALFIPHLSIRYTDTCAVMGWWKILCIFACVNIYGPAPPLLPTRDCLRPAAAVITIVTWGGFWSLTAESAGNITVAPSLRSVSIYAGMISAYCYPDTYLHSDSLYSTIYNLDTRNMFAARFPTHLPLCFL